MKLGTHMILIITTSKVLAIFIFCFYSAFEWRTVFFEEVLQFPLIFQNQTIKWKGNSEIINHQHTF